MSQIPKSNSIFNSQIKPYYQAGFAILILLIVMAISKAFISSDDDQIYFWEISFTILMAYGLFNAIFSIPYKDRMLYFRNSLLCYVVVAVSGGFLASLFSGISLDDSGSFRWLYVVFTFSYLVFISIVNAMRKIIEIAKKQDEVKLVYKKR